MKKFIPFRVDFILKGLGLSRKSNKVDEKVDLAKLDEKDAVNIYTLTLSCNRVPSHAVLHHTCDKFQRGIRVDLSFISWRFLKNE